MDNTKKFIKKLNFNRLTQEIKRKKKILQHQQTEPVLLQKLQLKIKNKAKILKNEKKEKKIRLNNFKNRTNSDKFIMLFDGFLGKQNIQIDKYISSLSDTYNFVYSSDIQKDTLKYVGTSLKMLIMCSNNYDIETIKIVGLLGVPVIFYYNCNTKSISKRELNIISKYPNIIILTNPKLLTKYVIFSHNYKNFTNLLVKQMVNFIHKKADRGYIIIVHIRDIDTFPKFHKSIIKQNIELQILCVCSKKSHYRYLRSMNMDTLYFDEKIGYNSGIRYQLALEFSKIYLGEDVFIFNCNTIMTSNYVYESIKYSKTGGDVFGLKNMLVYDTLVKKYYKIFMTDKLINNMIWRHSNQIIIHYGGDRNYIGIEQSSVNPLFFESGILLKRGFLEKVNWKLYPENKKEMTDLNTLLIYNLLNYGAKINNIVSEKFYTIMIKYNFDYRRQKLFEIDKNCFIEEM